MDMISGSSPFQDSSQAVRESLMGLIDGTLIVAMTDSRGSLVYVSSRFCEACGRGRDELLGANPRILKSGVHSSEFYAGMWRTLSSGQVWRGEICNRRSDGHLYWVSSNITPVVSKEGKITNYLALCFDITAQRFAQQKLQEKSRLALLGQFSDGVAHDLANFLTLAKYALAESVELSDRNREMLTGSINGMTSLTSRLRAVASGRANECHPFSLSSVVGYVVQLLALKPMYSSAVRVETTLAEVQDTQVCGDEGEIASILLNLLVNSCEALQKSENPCIMVTGRLRSHYIELLVSDNGPGVSETILSNLFQYHVSTKGAGRGLGLSASRQIARAHGGDLVYCGSSYGSVFVLRLPIT